MSMDECLVLTEADTCGESVTLALLLASWGKSPHAIGEQHAITAGLRFFSDAGDVVSAMLGGSSRALCYVPSERWR